MQYSWNSVPGSISFYIITVIWARLGEPYYCQALHSKYHAFHSIHFQRTPQRQVPWWPFDPSPRNIHKFPTGLSYSTLVREQGFSSYHPDKICKSPGLWKAGCPGFASGRGSRQSPGHWTLNSELQANGPGRPTLLLSLGSTKAYLVWGLLWDGRDSPQKYASESLCHTPVCLTALKKPRTFGEAYVW